MLRMVVGVCGGEDFLYGDYVRGVGEVMVDVGVIRARVRSRRIDGDMIDGEYDGYGDVD